MVLFKITELHCLLHSELGPENVADAIHNSSQLLLSDLNYILTFPQRFPTSHVRVGSSMPTSHGDIDDR